MRIIALNILQYCQDDKTSARREVLMALLLYM